MSKHTSTPQRVSNTAARAHAIPALAKTLRLHKTWPISLCVGLALGSIIFSSDALAGVPTGGGVVGGGADGLVGSHVVVAVHHQRVELGSRASDDVVRQQRRDQQA